MLATKGHMVPLTKWQVRSCRCILKSSLGQMTLSLTKPNAISGPGLFYSTIYRGEIPQNHHKCVLIASPLPKMGNLLPVRTWKNSWHPKRKPDPLPTDNQCSGANMLVREVFFSPDLSKAWRSLCRKIPILMWAQMGLISDWGLRTWEYFKNAPKL